MSKIYYCRKKGGEENRLKMDGMRHIVGSSGHSNDLTKTDIKQLKKYCTRKQGIEYMLDQKRKNFVYPKSVTIDNNVMGEFHIYETYNMKFL